MTTHHPEHARTETPEEEKAEQQPETQPAEQEEAPDIPEKTPVTPELIERLGLGEDAERRIEDARARILASENGPERLRIFEEALEHYASPESAEPGERPVYHSTGSFGLAKILGSGELSSVRNKVTGEQATTGRDAPETSLAVGGYASREAVSHFYARKNERRNHLQLDKQEIDGVPIEEDLVDRLFAERPDLSEEEKERFASHLKEQKEYAGTPDVSDEEFLESKLKELKERKYYFDEKLVRESIDRTRAEIMAAEVQEQDWKVEELKQRLANLEGRLQTYREETEEMRAEMDDPFPVILTYEGAQLPEKDLSTLVTGLVCERQTAQPIGNENLLKIEVPKDKMDRVREWVRRRAETLPEDSPERKALERLTIVPLEHFEAKRLVQE